MTKIKTNFFDISITEKNDRTQIMIDDNFYIQKTDNRNELTIWVNSNIYGVGGRWFSKKELQEKLFGEVK